MTWFPISNANKNYSLSSLSLLLSLVENEIKDVS